MVTWKSIDSKQKGCEKQGVVSDYINECLEFHQPLERQGQKKKELVMHSSVAHCCLIFTWILIFSSGMHKSKALQDYTGANLTLQLEALKSGMLEYLGMDRPPDLRGKASYRELVEMSHEYRTKRWQTQSFSSLFLHTTVQSLDSQQGQEGNTESTTQWFRAVFQKESLLTEEIILAEAQLHLQRQLKDNSDHSEHCQKVYVKIQETSGSDINTLFDTNIFTIEGHNVTLDVTFAVDKWLIKDSHTLLIVDIGFIKGKDEGPELIPQLCLELKLPVNKARQTRSTYGQGLEDDGHCGRRSLTVSFEEIGWSDWIVAPAGYTMYFCDGTCPHNYKPAGLHTQVKFRLHRLTKGATPRPCCVPAAYDPMILMHYDSRGKLKLTSFDDMIVTDCYCA
ncbi:bone morphogenetic protein 4 [Trichomycterus rosablanca]|uniref:bone morphogenetic protein 4 n=1 Tax=Trichomycterus rosablanca TaxID=2290929 RepID=UPI002F352F66